MLALDYRTFLCYILFWSLLTIWCVSAPVEPLLPAAEPSLGRVAGDHRSTTPRGRASSPRPLLLLGQSPLRPVAGHLDRLKSRPAGRRHEPRARLVLEDALVVGLQLPAHGPPSDRSSQSSKSSILSLLCVCVVGECSPSHPPHRREHGDRPQDDDDGEQHVAAGAPAGQGGQAAASCQ
jgi:hypothetical protein